MSTLAEVFRTRGAVQSFGKGHLLSLHEPDAVFLLEQGSLDLFARDTTKPHSLQYLGSLQDGLLFSFASGAPYAIFAKCVTPVTFIAWTRSALEQEGELSAEYAASLSHWQTFLAREIGGPPPAPPAAWEQAFIEALLQFLSAQDTLEQTTIASRAEEEQVNFDFALTQMEHVLIHGAEAVVKPSHDPLTQAFRTLAAHLQLSVSIPQGVRSRQIALPPRWWNGCHGPFLGFYKEKPVVFLPTIASSYKMVDGGKQIPVTRSIGEQCSRDAHMLYPPFPAEVRTGTQVLAFALKPNARALVMLLLFGLIGGVIGLFPPIATKLLFAYAIPESSPPLVFYITAGLICSALGLGYFYFVRNFLFLKIEGLTSHLIHTALWSRLLDLSTSTFRQFTAGNLFVRASSTLEVQTLVDTYAPLMTLNALASLLYLAMMFGYAPSLAAVVLGATLLSITLTTFTARSIIRLWRRIFELQGILRGVVIQMICGIGKIRVAGTERSAFAHWASSFARSKSLYLRLQHRQNQITAWNTFLPVLSMGLIYWLLLHNAGPNAISLPNFLAFNFALGSFIFSFYPLQTQFLQLIRAIPQWERTKPLFDAPTEERDQTLDPGPLTGHIRIDAITFGYDPALAPVLHQVSLEVHPKEFVAIVGPSGSGKSTLVRLLLGFETPTSGAIYLDGKDLSSLDKRRVRKQIGTVLQNEGILAGNLYENIASGGTYSQEELDLALHLSGFDQDLAEFPMGLHTLLPMNGSTLSGGQRQRLLLARALIGNPTLLLLDEATSSLDSQSQSAISHHLDQLPLTRIVIAQRLSTIQHATRIYVLDEGRIVQQGSFGSLSLEPGLFRDMLQRQQM